MYVQCKLTCKTTRAVNDTSDTNDVDVGVESPVPVTDEGSSGSLEGCRHTIGRSVQQVDLCAGEHCLPHGHQADATTTQIFSYCDVDL